MRVSKPSAVGTFCSALFLMAANERWRVGAFKLDDVRVEEDGEVAAMTTLLIIANRREKQRIIVR